jgi:hypothetical protein
MIAYTFPRTHILSLGVAKRRAARKKVIEKARQLELKSFIALMRRKLQLQGTTSLDTMA